MIVCTSLSSSDRLFCLQLHLAFLHDFSRHEDAIQLDLNFAAAINKALEGSNKAFIATSGIGKVLVQVQPDLPAAVPGGRIPPHPQLLTYVHHAPVILAELSCRQAAYACWPKCHAKPWHRQGRPWGAQCCAAVGGEKAEPWKESDPMPNAATKRVKCEEAILKVPCLLQPSSCQLSPSDHNQVRHALEC